MMEDKDLELNIDDSNEEEQQSLSGSEILDEISIQEELKRIDLQDNPISEIPEALKSEKVYKESIDQAYIIGECFQVLLGYGIDYNNALACATNIIQNRVEIKKFELQGTQIQQQVV